MAKAQEREKVTQCDRILRYIQDFGSITALDAMRDLGVMRLASRIHDLKVRGHRIEDKNETVLNRYQEKVSIKRYFLAG